MGLFDQVVGAAEGALGARTGDDSGAGGLGAVVQMLQSQGGVGAVLDRFHESGLGGLAASWCGEGANAPVSPDQVREALGSGPVAEVAQKLGLDPNAAADHISQVLPQLMDHLTPGGEPAQGGALEGLLGGLMGHFGGARPG